MIDGDGVHADGDAPFSFEVHRVEKLVLKIALADGFGAEQELVRQSALAMIDMGDNRKIANQTGIRAHAWRWFRTRVLARTDSNLSALGLKEEYTDPARQCIGQGGRRYPLNECL